MLIFNWQGLTMAAFAFAAAFGVGHLLGTDEEGPLMMVAGPLCTLFDLFFRWKSIGGHWLSPNGGGMFFFIPLWMLGILWLILGMMRAT